MARKIYKYYVSDNKHFYKTFNEKEGGKSKVEFQKVITLRAQTQ